MAPKVEPDDHLWSFQDPQKNVEQFSLTVSCSLDASLIYPLCHLFATVEPDNHISQQKGFLGPKLNYLGILGLKMYGTSALVKTSL